MASTSLDGLRVAVPGAIARRSALLDFLAGMGARASIVPGPLPTRDDCDLLLLYRNARLFRHRIAELEAMGAARPPTVLWQHEPLLPEEMDREREAAALAVLAREPKGMPGRILHRHATRGVFRALMEEGMGPYSRDPATHIEPLRLRSLMESWAFIRRGAGEGWIDRVFVTTRQKCWFLESRGVSASFVPIGSSAMDGRRLDTARDIDVVFLGATARHGARRAKLAGVGAALRAAGLTFHVVPPGTYGEERTRILNRAKVLLHLHNIPWDTPWKRWNIACAAGLLVVSEPLARPGPFLPGTHHLEAPLAEMPAVIADVLASYPERTAPMVEACYELSRELTTTRSLTMIGDVARELM